MIDLTLRALQGRVCENDDIDDDVVPPPAFHLQVSNIKEANFPALINSCSRSTDRISYSGRKKSIRCYQTVSSSDKSHRTYHITVIII
jgi:hypothetical protein